MSGYSKKMKGNNINTKTTYPLVVKQVGYTSMEGGPLRAIILDNDETTGSYQLLALGLQKAIGKGWSIEESVAYLTTKLYSEGAFRNGIIDFLKTINDLRVTNKVDAVIMYTNMSLEPRLKTANGYEYTKAEILGMIFTELLIREGILMHKPFFDMIVSRRIRFPGTKYMSYILNEYNASGPGSKIIFFDDKPDAIIVPNDAKNITLKKVNVYSKKYKKENMSRILELNKKNTILNEFKSGTDNGLATNFAEDIEFMYNIFH
jgi:hypothetical protein